jgi:hypothetical protein
MPDSKPNFNVADGNVGPIYRDGSPLAVIKGLQPNTWFYVPRAARIAKQETTKAPLFLVARNRVHAENGQGLKTLGGLFAAQLDVTAPAPSLDEMNQWTEQIKLAADIAPEQSRSFRFQPLRLRDGKMNIIGVNDYVVDPKALVDIPIGASTTVPITLQLNPKGADMFASALKTNHVVTLPLVVSLNFKYDMVLPACHYKITADLRRVYDYFSINAKARASYFGLVGGQADISVTRQALETSGAIQIEQISRPDKLTEERVKQLEDSIVQAWTKNVLRMITNPPTMDPAVAPNPQGFFGGVSVSMKSFREVESLNLSAEYNSQQVLETDFSMSYVLGQEFAILDSERFLLDVNDDNKLPIVINLAKTSEINLYSGQFGYRKPDGIAVTNSITAVKGEEGAVLSGQIQYAANEPRPGSVNVQLSMDWINSNWEDRVDEVNLEVKDSGVAFEFSPANYIVNTQILTDLEMLPPGSISVISWRTQLPAHQGRPVKVYSGASHLLGKGNPDTDGGSGLFRGEQTIKFPIRPEAQDDGKLSWSLVVTRPGQPSIKKLNNEQSVNEAALIVFSGLLEE